MIRFHPKTRACSRPYSSNSANAASSADSADSPTCYPYNELEAGSCLLSLTRLKLSIYGKQPWKLVCKV